MPDVKMDVSRQMEEYGQKIAELQATVITLEEERDELKKKCKSAQADYSKLKKELQEAKDKLDGLQSVPRLPEDVDAERLSAYVRNMNDAVTQSANTVRDISRDLLKSENSAHRAQLELSLEQLEQEIAQLRPEEDIYRGKSSFAALFALFFNLRVFLYTLVFRYRCSVEEHKQKRDFQKRVNAALLRWHVWFGIAVTLFVATLVFHILTL